MPTRPGRHFFHPYHTNQAFHTMGGRHAPLGFGGGLSSSAATPPPSDHLLLGLTALAIVSHCYAFFILRPRAKGGSSAPPIVTTSPVCGVPVVGTIVEFGKSPVKMVKRCYDEYGPVFTVPVSVLVFWSYCRVFVGGGEKKMTHLQMKLGSEAIEETKPSS